MELKLDKRSRRALWLLSGTAVYLVFGAYVFSFFEYENELQLRANNTENLRIMKLKYKFEKADYIELEKAAMQSIPFSAGLQWKFVGAFYFCTVVITTVGYGHSTPATWMGKLFCMLFALVGIPLGLVMFQSVGERINYCIRICLIKSGRFLSKCGIHSLREVKSRHLLFVSFSIGTLTIIIGTIVFHVREQWTLFDAYYYCVITLSTIGFGDYVPLQSKGRLQEDLGYVIFTLFFILFGLAIFSACVNLLILEFMAHNADIVTARTRLRRLLSLKATPSFRGTSLRTALPSYRRNRRRTLAATAISNSPTLLSVPMRSASATELFVKMKRDSCDESAPHVCNLTSDNAATENNEKSLTANNNTPETFSPNGIVPESDSERAHLLYMRDVHGYYRLKPAYFTARRLPTRYIDHLVNTSAPTNPPYYKKIVHNGTCQKKLDHTRTNHYDIC